MLANYAISIQITERVHWHFDTLTTVTQTPTTLLREVGMYVCIHCMYVDTMSGHEDNHEELKARLWK